MSCLAAEEGEGGGGVTEAAALPLTAAVRALERLVPRCATGLLLAELAKGRLMEGVRRAFLSTCTDLRRGVVALLVALHAATAATGAFARYAEAYLTLPQQKLLAIYIEKGAAAAAGAATAGGR